MGDRHPHNPSKCGGVGVCLPCSTEFEQANKEIKKGLTLNELPVITAYGESLSPKE